MKKLLIIAALVAFTVWGLWFIAVPESVIVRALNFESGIFSVEASGFEKGLFYNFRIGNIGLKRAGKKLISADGITGSVNLFSLARLKTEIKFKGGISGGRLNGTAVFKGKHRDIDIFISGADLAELVAGTKGRIEAEAHIKDAAGDAKFSIDNAEITPVGLIGLDIPSLNFHTARGALDFAGQSLDLRSFALEGDGVYARLKGGIKGGSVNMELELMPEGEMDPVVAAFIAKYKVSPGYYKIPVKRELKL